MGTVLTLLGRGEEPVSASTLGGFFYSSMSVRSSSLLLFSLTELFKSLKSVKYQHLCNNYAKHIYKLKLGLCYLTQEQILLL